MNVRRRPLAVIPEVLYVLGDGDTGEVSGLFFSPNENAGDFGLFDSRMLASEMFCESSVGIV